MADALELGHALLTMVEPDAATVREYNRWYETDHFLSGVLAGPGAYAGRRWVATAPMKGVRFPSGSPIAQPLAAGSFIATYWIERDQLDAHCAWGFPEAARLAGLGRMRSDRTHVSTSYYDLQGAASRGDHQVPKELALQHPYGGLVVVWTEGTGDRAAHDAAATALRDGLVADSSPIAQVISFRAIRLPEPLPAMPGAVPGDAEVRRDVVAHCCFVDADVRQTWIRTSMAVHEALRTSGATALLVAPFLPAVAGTDTYLDELW
jgi:hypothetical protein